MHFYVSPTHRMALSMHVVHRSCVFFVIVCWLSGGAILQACSMLLHPGGQHLLCIFMCFWIQG